MAVALDEKYGLFWGDTLEYNQRIDKYQRLSLDYPDSHYLMKTLAEKLSRYKQKEDILKIYSNFSDKNKESYFGLKAQRFLDMNFFENSMLPTWDERQMESIINDTTKYSLIIFSASWCGPCHKQIPNLKKMYSELHDKLNMVYISIDGPETVDEWKKLMVNEQIPWRSLLAVNDVKGLQSKYFIQSIPEAFLVNPSGKMYRIKHSYEEKELKFISAIIDAKL